MLYQNLSLSAKAAGLFPLRRLSKTLSYCRSSPRSIPLSNRIYILAFKVEEGPLVRRGYVFNRGKNYKEEGNEKERGEDLSYLRPALILPWLYNTS
jgi:hypothetical protein